MRPWTATRFCRLTLLLAAGLLVLGGCAPTSRGMLDALRQSLPGSSTLHPTAASVAARPYFQLQVKTPTGEAILILGSVEGDLLGWYGKPGEAVFTRHGVVVRTLGLTQNLDDTRWPHANPFARGLQHLRGPTPDQRVLDLSPGYRYGAELQMQLQPGPLESVAILGTVRRLQRIDETVRMPALGLHGENRYWLDPADGFIWKSRQLVAPGMALELTVLRRYREPAA